MATAGNSIEAKHHPDRAMSQALLKALYHPVRRGILRQLNRAKAELPPNYLASELGVKLSTLSFHIRLLVEKNVIRCTEVQSENGCFATHFYVSNVERNELVLQILEDLEEEDKVILADSAQAKVLA